MKIALFALLAFLWGGSFIAIKIVVATAPPFWAAALRLLMSLAFLAVYYRLTHKTLTIPKNLRLRVLLSGLTTQGIPFAFLFWGEQTISPGLSGILNGTTPIWTFIFGALFIRQHEPFTRKKLVGLLLGIAGILLIFGPKLQMGLANSSTLGALSVGMMGMTYGIGNIFNKSLMVHKDRPSLESSLFYQTIIACTFVTILAVIFEGAPHLDWIKDYRFVTGTLYMGWLSTAVAFIVYYRLIDEMGAVKASSVAYLIPLTAVFLDFAINKNVPSGLDISGMAVILVGVFIIQDRRLRTH